MESQPIFFVANNYNYKYKPSVFERRWVSYDDLSSDTYYASNTKEVFKNSIKIYENLY